MSKVVQKAKTNNSIRSEFEMHDTNGPCSNLLYKTEKQQYVVNLYFKEDCEMLLIRAYDIINKMSQIANIIKYYPENLLEASDEIIENYIKKNGFRICFSTEIDFDFLKEELEDVYSIESFELVVEYELSDLNN